MHSPKICTRLFPALLAAPLMLGVPAFAADTDLARSYQVDASFEDMVLDLRLAIEGRGFVIDSVSHIGTMLNRTAADVGAATNVYEHAEVVQFCSATVSRKVMEIDPMNIAFCPYGIFVFQLTGADQVTVGYRRFPEGPMQDVDALLDSLVHEAAGLN